MARRSEHSQEEIKRMVIQAAETIIVEDGLGKLKARNIALEIGYTVGSIYMVFDSMGDLITHLKARTLDDIATALENIPQNAPAADCLNALAKTYINFANEHLNRWKMLFDHSQITDASPPEWYKEKAQQLFKPIVFQFERLAPHASAEQRLRAAYALWGGVHGVCALSLAGSLDVVGVKDVEDTVVLLVENFIRGWMLEHCNPTQ